MDVAEAMLTVAELEVGAPVIMHSNALVVGQDASGLHADMSAFVMHLVLGQLFCAGHVQPPQLPCDTHAALIEMDDRRSNQLLANLEKTALCVLGKLARGGPNPGRPLKNRYRVSVMGIAVTQMYVRFLVQWTCGLMGRSPSV